MTGPAQTLPDPVPERPFDPWNFRIEVTAELHGAPLKGHKLEAIDGRVGTVSDAHTGPDDSYLIVTVGKLGIGKQTQLPAGTVNHVDLAERRVYVDRTRDQIKSAPTVGSESHTDPAHREQVADYYQQTYGR